MVKYSILNIQVEKTTYFKEINVCKCPCKLLARVFSITSSGSFTSSNVDTSMGVRPTISLKPSVKFTGGNGSKENPYIVG